MGTKRWQPTRRPLHPSHLFFADHERTMSDIESLEGLLRDSSDPNNPSAESIRALFERMHRIAVVGMSKNPEKQARRVPSYLASKGYDIIPVNPTADRIIGKAVKAKLSDVDEPVDMVIVFRPSPEAAAVLQEAAARPEQPVIWLQKGILAGDAAEVARAAGRFVVQDLCTYEVHRALYG